MRSFSESVAVVNTLFYRLTAVVVTIGFLVSFFRFTPTRAASPADVTRIGAVGCSITWQHVQAYHDSSSIDKFWPWESVKSYSGGTVANWANPDAEEEDRYWNTFNANAAQYPDTNVVWIQLCFRANESSSTGITTEQQSNLTYTINRVKQILPEATLIVSPQNGFVMQDCGATGPYGQLNAVELADWAVSQGLALRGPDTGPLDHSQLRADLCHLNKFGSAFVGPQMATFFDNFAPPPPTTYWCVDSSVVTITDGSTPSGSYVAGPFTTAEDAANDPGCVPPPPVYWCVDGSVVSLTDGSTPEGSYVAGPFNTIEEAAADPGCPPPPAPVYWCVDGSVLSLTDGSTPTGTYVAGPYGSQAAAEADPGCIPPPPSTTYWCVDGSVLTINDGSTPAGGYVAGPFDTTEEAAVDDGCVTPRISTSTNPIYAGQAVTFTDYYNGTNKRSWNMGNGAVINNGNAAQTYTYSALGTYTVTLETKNTSGVRVILTRVITVLAPL